MGAIIDNNTNETPSKCTNVKLAVIWISLICSSITLLFLIFCIINMIKKNNITTLTTIILLIFFGEVIQCISKLLQMLKYAFTDRRQEEGYEVNGRGIICVFQIVLAIYADSCSLICTFLLSLKCYDALKYKNKYFSNDKSTKTKIIILTIIISLVIGFVFLIIDIFVSKDEYNNRYDRRDYCSYWCWLGQLTSGICYFLYYILIIANIVLSVKICKFVNRKLIELSEKNEQMIPNNVNFSKQGNKCSKSAKVKKSTTYEERANDLMLIKTKYKVYPLVTIIFWVLASLYRFFDNIISSQYNNSDSEEKEYFDEHPILAILDQSLLVLHTFLVSTRGLFYGASLVFFEEKMFGNLFKKWLRAKSEIYTELKEDKKDDVNNEEESSDEDDCNDDEDNNEKVKIKKTTSADSENGITEVKFVEE